MAWSKQAKKKTQIISAVAVVIILAASALYYNFFAGGKKGNISHDPNDLVMTAIDIGQGDSILITQGEHAILIDAGPNESQDKLIKYLQSQKIRRFDLVIATHPHADHIGGMDKVIENFQIDNFLMTELPDNMVPTTKTYEKLATALIDKKINVTAAMSGQSYNIGDMKLDVLAPVTLDHDDLNNFSVVTRLTYGKTVIMLTGDSEKEVEKQLLASGEDLACDIYKVGHHGSDTSSSKKFLDAMHPQYAVIPCGNDNSYNHPNEKTLKKLEERGIRYYATKECGTVRFISDGSNISVELEKETVK